MYQVCAVVNDVEYRKVLLDENYQFSADKLLGQSFNRIFEYGLGNIGISIQKSIMSVRITHRN